MGALQEFVAKHVGMRVSTGRDGKGAQLVTHAECVDGKIWLTLQSGERVEASTCYLWRSQDLPRQE